MIKNVYKLLWSGGNKPENGVSVMFSYWWVE